METANKKIPIEIHDLIVKVYNSIALWHNQDGTPEQKQIDLKLVSQEIVSTVLNDAFVQIGGFKTSEAVLPKSPKQAKAAEPKKGLFSRFRRK